MASAILRRLLVQAGQFQQVVAILRLQLRRLAEVRVGVADPSLLHQRLRHAKLGSRGLCVERNRQLVALFRLGVVAGLQLRFGQVVARAELLRLLRRGVLEERQRLHRILLPQQHDAAVQLRLVQPRLEFQRLAILGDGLRIALQQRVGHRQIEVGEIVFGIRLDGFAECLRGGLVLTLVEGLHAFGGVIGL